MTWKNNASWLFFSTKDTFPLSATGYMQVNTTGRTEDGNEEGRLKLSHHLRVLLLFPKFTRKHMQHLAAGTLGETFAHSRVTFLL